MIDSKNSAEEEGVGVVQEKTLPMSLTNAMSINALLEKGLNLIEIQRLGAGGRDTRYAFAPV